MIENGEHIFPAGGVNYALSVYGSGKFPLLAFPGFYRSSNDFKVFEPSLGKKFKIISFDLIHHGKTSLMDADVTINSEHFHLLVEKFSSAFGFKEFSLLGYSFGAKICFGLAEIFPDRIKDMILLAPYGIRSNPVLHFLTGFSWSEHIFKWVVENPTAFFKVIDFLSFLKLLPENRNKFLHHQMESEERRLKLFEVWRTYRFFQPDMHLVQTLINRHHINLLMYFGIFDPVENPIKGKVFARRIRQQGVVREVPLNHQLVLPAMNDIFLKDLVL